MVMGQLDSHMQKNEVGLFTLYTKTSSKWSEDHNVRAKTINLLGKNIQINFHYFGFGNEFLTITATV